MSLLVRASSKAARSPEPLLRTPQHERPQRARCVNSFLGAVRQRLIGLAPRHSVVSQELWVLSSYIRGRLSLRGYGIFQRPQLSPAYHAFLFIAHS